jgi:hypothetical protein
VRFALKSTGGNFFYRFSSRPPSPSVSSLIKGASSAQARLSWWLKPTHFCSNFRSFILTAAAAGKNGRNFPLDFPEKCEAKINSRHKSEG